MNQLLAGINQAFICGVFIVWAIHVANNLITLSIKIHFYANLIRIVGTTPKSRIQNAKQLTISSSLYKNEK